MSDFVMRRRDSWSTNDRTRTWIKGCEFRLQPSSAAILHRLLGTPDPYTSREHDLQAIFVHIPKAAGTSIRSALFGPKNYHVPISRYAAFDNASFRRYFKFCFVRNPWARLHSAFYYLNRRVGSDPSFPDHRWATAHLAGVRDFEDFVLSLRRTRFRNRIRQYVHFRNQLDWVSISGGNGRYRVLAVDFVGRYESLAQDYATVCERIGISQELPVMRQGTGDDYHSAYSDRMRDIVAEIYARDIETFGYEFDSSPREVAT